MGGTLHPTMYFVFPCTKCTFQWNTGGTLHPTMYFVFPCTKCTFQWNTGGTLHPTMYFVFPCMKCTFQWNTDWCSPIPPSILLAHSHLSHRAPMRCHCQLVSSVTGVVCKCSSHSSSVADTAMFSFERTFFPPACRIRG